METKIIRVTDKGQISLPTGIREYLKINKGDELIVTRSNETIVLKKIKRKDFSDLLKHSERVAKKLWGNKEDEVWNNV